jgi:hypothetical protein
VMRSRNRSIGFTFSLHTKIGDCSAVRTRNVDLGNSICAPLYAHGTIVTKEGSVLRLAKCANVRMSRTEREAIMRWIHSTIARAGQMRIRVFRDSTVLVLNLSHNSFKATTRIVEARKRRSLGHSAQHLLQPLTSAQYHNAPDP